MQVYYEAGAPELIERRSFLEWAKSSALHAAARQTPRSESEIEMAKQRQAKARLDAAKKKLKARREKLLAPPPDPRAASISAAVLAELLFDGLQRKLRKNALVEGDFGQVHEMSVVDRLFEPEDMAVAFILFLHLLEEHGEVVISNYASWGSWLDSTLPPVEPPRLFA